MASSRFFETLGSADKKAEQPREVEFFFYAKRKAEAESLQADLEKLGYEIYGIGLSIRKQFSVTGKTIKISLDEKAFSKWAEHMNELAFANNCFFDGWGMLCEDPDLDKF